MPISIRGEITAVELLLMDILTLAFLRRLPPLANVAALIARPIDAVLDGALLYVTAEDRLYRWIEYSTAIADGINVLQPATLPVGITKGRWHRVTTSLTYGPNGNAPLQSRQTGVCPQVLLYRGDETYNDFVTQVYGHEPSMFLTWLGDAPQPKSAGFRGSLYRNVHSFTLFIGSQCLRPQPAVSWGSPLPAEAAEDPGINALIGEARYVLAGIDTGITGIEFVEIGEANKVHEDIDERVFVYALRLTVQVSYSHEDADLVPLLLETETRDAADAQGATRFDPRNYVLEGLQLSVGPGGPLAQTVAAGVAIVEGAPVVVAATPHTFPADSDVYRDLDGSGALLFTAVAAGDPAPALAAGSLRLARTRTAASEVEQDFWLCSFSLHREGPYAV